MTSLTDPLFDTRRQSPLDIALGVTKTDSRRIKAHLYKHILEDVDVLLIPDTFEVLGEAPPRLREFLGHASMRELVELEIFIFDMAVDVFVETEVVDGPVPEEAESS